MTQERYWEHLSGRQLADERSVSMTTTMPPPNTTWSSRTLNRFEEDEANWRELRLTWLDQYELEISDSPEKGFRVWRWLGNFESNEKLAYVDKKGNQRKVVWTERRFWDEPLPSQPGLWPQDR